MLKIVSLSPSLPMEALNIIRVWKTRNGGHTENQWFTNHSTTEVPQAVIASDHELDEGDDSFFDLEIPLHGCEDNGNVVNGERRFESKRKIIPIESSSNRTNTQSPIALLKPGPKFPVFTLKKSKSMADTSRADISDKPGLFGPPKNDKQGKTDDDSSKRLLKDLMQKYLKKFKTLYVKASKKSSLKVSGDFPVSSPASSPSLVFPVKEKQARGRGVYKQLVKSRSTSAASSSPISRRDDSLLLQHDGIQSAILHCKKSLNSSRDSSLLHTRN